MEVGKQRVKFNKKYPTQSIHLPENRDHELIRGNVYTPLGISLPSLMVKVESLQMFILSLIAQE